jgi:hypothetical protein
MKLGLFHLKTRQYCQFPIILAFFILMAFCDSSGGEIPVECLAGMMEMELCSSRADCEAEVDAGHILYYFENGECRINAPKIFFVDAQILGAVPVVKQGVGYERVCRRTTPGATIDGFAMDLGLLSTVRKASDGEAYDTDVSIHPGDYINRVEVLKEQLAPDKLELSVNCLKQIEAGAALERQCESAADMLNPLAQIVDVEHVAQAIREESWGKGEGPGIGVVVLVDQSGSVAGFVDPDPENGHIELPYDEANIAITDWQQTQDPQILDRLASDRKRYRISALEQFTDTLNVNDKLLIAAYNGSSGVRLVCESPELDAANWDDCFSTRRDWVTRGLERMAGTESGRTPLWKALYQAYEFLSDRDDVGARHIVVLNDGPDTCHPDSDHYSPDIGQICADRSLQDVRSLIEGNNGLPVHVHFVQHQAAGYTERDLGQMEVSCMTDGSYTFVNRVDLSDTEFGDAPFKALERVRHSFLGKWRFIVEMHPLGVDLPWPQGIPPGYGYLLDGHVKLLTNEFITTAQLIQFAVGNQSMRASVQSTPNWDNRLFMWRN